MTDTTRHTVDPKHVIKRQGKDMVLYVGLLDAAHRAGLAGIETEILQYPSDLNAQTTIVRATVRMWIDYPKTSGCREFSGIGDANPKNVGGTIIPHAIRMAETRAKARALRDALNVGMVTVEELGGDDDDGNAAAKPAPRQQPTLREREEADARVHIRLPPAPPSASKPSVPDVLAILGEMDDAREPWHDIKRYADDQAAGRDGDDVLRIHDKLKAIAARRKTVKAPAGVNG